jgi:hypothetical protein
MHLTTLGTTPASTTPVNAAATQASYHRHGRAVHISAVMREAVAIILARCARQDARRRQSRRRRLDD